MFTSLSLGFTGIVRRFGSGRPPRPLMSLCLFALLALGSAAYADVLPPGLAADGYAANAIVVKRAPGSELAPSTQQVIASRAALALPDYERWQLPPGIEVAAAIETALDDPAVLYAEPDLRRRARQSGPTLSQFTQQAALDHMKLDGALDQIAAEKNAVIVAVIDDSIDVFHPAIRPYIATTDGAPLADDLSNLLGGDFADAGNDPSPGHCTDDLGRAFSHGTMVAGMIAAMIRHGENRGADSIDLPIRIMPLRIGCGYFVSSEIQAIAYAAKLANSGNTYRAAQVVNASYGAPIFSVGELEALARLTEAGILLVGAAGNFGQNNDRVPDYPSSVDLSNILAVTAYSALSNRLTDWAHYGPTSVDVAAPGAQLIVADSGEDASGNIVRDYSYESGTSFAAPLVAGVAALMRVVDASADYHALKGGIMAAVDPLNDVGRLVTDGAIDADAAVAQLKIPKPVMVVNQVAVDDRGAGNGNGLVDPFEDMDIVLTLENLWAEANGVTAALSVNGVFADMASHDQPVAPGELITLRFPWRQEAVTGHQYIPLKVEITADGQVYTRNLFLETGPLEAGVALADVINDPANGQDEFHYHHITVPSGVGDLTFQLTTQSGKQLHLLVRAGAPPQFNYDTYDLMNAALFGGVTAGTYVSARPESHVQSIRIARPIAGTYHAVVLVPPETQTALDNRVPYTLVASYGPLRRSSGCTVSQGSADPMLPLLLALSCLYLGWRRVNGSLRAH